MVSSPFSPHFDDLLRPEITLVSENLNQYLINVAIKSVSCSQWCGKWYVKLDSELIRSGGGSTENICSAIEPCSLMSKGTAVLNFFFAVIKAEDKTPTESFSL